MDQATSPETQADLDAFLGVPPRSRRAQLLKWGAVAVGVVLLLLLVNRLFFGAAAATQYATREVERGDLTVTVSATGNLQPTNQVDVGSELSGLVTDVYVDNNDRVRKGQVLARLDLRRLQDAIDLSRAALQSAQAQVAQAQATERQARANFGRLEQVYKLSGGKVPSATELDTGRADLARAVAGIRTAQAAVAQARAQLSADQTQFSRGSILSPVNGVVLSRQIEPGQTVAASLNAPVLFQIAEDLGQMQLEVKVDEADVGQVRDGQRATFAVDAFPGRQFPARIARVDVGANASGSTTSASTGTSSSASSASGSVVAYTAVLSVDNPDQLLRPGMTATADIVTTEKRDVLLVPNAALRFTPDEAAGAGDRGFAGAIVRGPPRRNRRTQEVAIGRGSRQTVYVRRADGGLDPIEVTVGDSNGSQTEVSSRGLRAGMEVVTGQLAGDAAAGSRRQGQSGQGQGGQAGQRRQGQGAGGR